MEKSYLLSRTRSEMVPLGQCICPSALVDLLGVQKLADEFDWLACGQPLVWETSPNVYRVLDGIQRVAAACSRFGPGEVIRCEVIRGITAERAAELRTARNDRAPVGPGEPPGLRLA